MSYLRFTPTRKNGAFDVSLPTAKIAKVFIPANGSPRTVTPTGRKLSPAERKGIAAFEPTF